MKTTLFLQFLQHLSGTGNGGFIYLPVSIANWWALILILVLRDLLNIKQCICEGLLQIFYNEIRLITKRILNPNNVFITQN
jgi:hypothetical protein